MSTPIPCRTGIAARDTLILGRVLHDLRGYVETLYIGITVGLDAGRDPELEEFPNTTIDDLVRGIRYHAGRISELHPEADPFAGVVARLGAMADAVVTRLRDVWDGEPRAAARSRAARLHAETDGHEHPRITGELLVGSPFGPAGWVEYAEVVAAVDAHLPGGDAERAFFRLGSCLGQLHRPWVSVWAAPPGSNPHGASYQQYELLPKAYRLLDAAGAATGLHVPRVPVDRFVPAEHLQPFIDAILSRLPEGLLTLASSPVVGGGVADGPALPSPASGMDPERRRTLLAYLGKIDPERRLAGESDRWLEVVEAVRRLGAGPCRAVLLTGEPGTGKSELAAVIGRTRSVHSQTSTVAQKPPDTPTPPPDALPAAGQSEPQPKDKPRKARRKGSDDRGTARTETGIAPAFHRYSAARSTATDAVGPRGEWVGYAPKSGYSGVDPKGVAGLLKRYDGGTILVDEFADLSEEIQTLLLDVTEGKEVVPVGASGVAFAPNVRLVFATNKNVTAHIRRDLLDRIHVRVALPPLRDRVGDLFLLVGQFLSPTNYRLDLRTWELLLRSDWPGNVRQLKSLVENVLARADADGLAAPPDGGKKRKTERAALPFDYFASDEALTAVVALVSPDETVAETVVYPWLERLLRGWGYKPRERRPRATEAKGGMPSSPESVSALYRRMAELLLVSPSAVSRAVKRLRPPAEGGEEDTADE